MTRRKEEEGEERDRDSNLIRIPDFPSKMLFLDRTDASICTTYESLLEYLHQTSS